MRLSIDSHKFRLLSASVTFALLVLITGSLVPQAYGFNFDNHQICKGWTQQDEPITANKFNTGETVYLYFNISWTSIQEYEQKWGETFKISLVDPSGAEVNTFSTMVLDQVYYEYGCESSAFLEVLDITSTTKNGRWKLNWYDGNTLLFREEFVVGEEQAGPSPSPGQQTPLDTLVPLIAVIIAIIIALVAIIIYLSRRKKKTPETTGIPPPPPRTCNS